MRHATQFVACGARHIIVARGVYLHYKCPLGHYEAYVQPDVLGQTRGCGTAWCWPGGTTPRTPREGWPGRTTPRNPWEGESCLVYASVSAPRSADSPNRLPRRARAAVAISAATAGESRRKAIARAMSSGLRGGTSRPVSPGITTSATALTAVATTGTPQTMASTITVGRPS